MLLLLLMIWKAPLAVGAESAFETGVLFSISSKNEINLCFGSADKSTDRIHTAAHCIENPAFIKFYFCNRDFIPEGPIQLTTYLTHLSSSEQCRLILRENFNFNEFHPEFEGYEKYAAGDLAYTGKKLSMKERPSYRSEIELRHSQKFVLETMALNQSDQKRFSVKKLDLNFYYAENICQANGACYLKVMLPESDLHEGNSGSPLYYVTQENGRTIKSLVGILSSISTHAKNGGHYVLFSLLPN